MIGSLTGLVEQIGADSILLNVGGVGYRVFALPGLIATLKPQGKLTVYTHMQVREDEMSLYGFATMRELALFQLLLQAPGVGPKSALGVMVIGTVDVIIRAIGQGDAALLTTVSGIGRKTAERIVVELKSKLEKQYPALSASGATAHADVVRALESLGYTGAQARDAVRALPPDLQNVEQGIRAALKALAPRVDSTG